MDSNKQNILREIINTLLKKNYPFVVYKFPGEENTCVVVQTEKIHLVLDLNEICQRHGFVIAPFESVTSETGYFIRPDLFACDENGYKKILEEIEKFPSNRKSELGQENREITKDEYIETASFLIDQIKSGVLQKVVLSRTIKKTLPKNFSISDFYLKLNNKYKNSFVYLFNIPDEGMWIGATPETLVKENETGEVEVMSLAGTVAVDENEDLKKVKWTEKELYEQELVSNYIRSKISGMGIKDYIEKPVETVKAGHLAHLRTMFIIPSGSLKNKIGEFIKRIHPTPAVCGLNKVDAYNLIEKAELHDRKYYTGYLGPWGLKNKKHLFVNLRCAEVRKNKIVLYVGGGLTKDSIPEKEWEETEQKAKVLLSELD